MRKHKDRQNTHLCKNCIASLYHDRFKS